MSNPYNPYTAEGTSSSASSAPPAPQPQAYNPYAAAMAAPAPQDANPYSGASSHSNSHSSAAPSAPPAPNPYGSSSSAASAPAPTPVPAPSQSSSSSAPSSSSSGAAAAGGIGGALSGIRSKIGAVKEKAKTSVNSAVSQARNAVHGPPPPPPKPKFSSLPGMVCNPCEQDLQDFYVSEAARNHVCEAIDPETSQSCADSSMDSPLVCIRGFFNLILVPFTLATQLVISVLSSLVVGLMVAVFIPCYGFRVICKTPYMTPLLKFFCVLSCPLMSLVYFLRALFHALGYAVVETFSTLLCGKDPCGPAVDMSRGTDPEAPVGMRAFCCAHGFFSFFFACRNWRSMKHAAEVMTDRLINARVQRDRPFECCGLKLITAFVGGILASVISLVVCGIPCGFRFFFSVCFHYCTEKRRMASGATCAKEVEGRGRNARRSVPDECCCCEGTLMLAWYCFITPFHAFATFFVHMIVTVWAVLASCMCNVYEQSHRYDFIGITGLWVATKNCWTGQKALQVCDSNASKVLAEEHDHCVIERECDDCSSFTVYGDRAKMCCQLDNTPGQSFMEGSGLLNSERQRPYDTTSSMV